MRKIRPHRARSLRLESSGREKSLETLTLKLLGGFEARTDRAETLTTPTRKGRALLAVLATAPHMRQSRERLAALLWERSAEEQARASLRQTLSEVRKALGVGLDGLLDADAEYVWLDKERVSTDVAEFERLAGSSDPDDVEGATGIWTGEFLDGFSIRSAEVFEDWLATERRRLHGLWLKATDAQLERAIVQGRTERGIETARRVLESEPLRESTHRALMRLLAAQGNRAGALEQYEQCRALLAQELDTSPDVETETLAQRIRADAPRRAPSDDVTRELAPHPPERPSIAVLPFQNMSDDREQEYFSDGISEDVITALSRYRTLFVVARNSSFAYRQRNVDARRIAEELGVHYLLEGSVRRAGNRVRITAQLVDGRTGDHIWAERYDRNLEDLFEVQDDVTAIIVSTTAGRLDADGAGRSALKLPENLDAYDHCLRGLQQVHRYTREGYALAREAFKKAIQADPLYARPHAWLSYLHTVDDYFYDISQGSLDAALERGRCALALDEHESQVHLALGIAHEFSWQHEPAAHHFERGLALNPNDDLLTVEYARFLQYIEREMEGIDLVRKAMRLNPFYPDWYWNIMGRCWHAMGRYADAVDAFERIEIPPFWVNAYLAACNQQLGRIDRAKLHRNRTLEEYPGFRISEYSRLFPYRNAAIRERLLDTLRTAGLPD